MKNLFVSKKNITFVALFNKFDTINVNKKAYRIKHLLQETK